MTISLGRFVVQLEGRAVTGDGPVGSILSFEPRMDKYPLFLLVCYGVFSTSTELILQVVQDKEGFVARSMGKLD